MGTAVIRLADADLLPFEFTNLADTVTRYITELQTLLTQRQDDIRERNRADRRRRVRGGPRSEEAAGGAGEEGCAAGDQFRAARERDRVR